MSFRQVLDVHVSPNFRYLSKLQIPAILVYIFGTPIWRTEYRVNIWNLLWLIRPVINSIEQTGIYLSTSRNALTSKRAQNHEIRKQFSSNSMVALCHAPP